MATDTDSEEEIEYKQENEERTEIGPNICKLNMEIRHHSEIECRHNNNLNLTVNDKVFQL
eukprot:10844621-Ditylum_brightwellii.AAC.1